MRAIRLKLGGVKEFNFVSNEKINSAILFCIFRNNSTSTNHPNKKIKYDLVVPCFEIVEKAWAKFNMTLVDLKIELGYDKDSDKKELFIASGVHYTSRGAEMLSEFLINQLRDKRILITN